MFKIWKKTLHISIIVLILYVFESRHVEVILLVQGFVPMLTVVNFLCFAPCIVIQLHNTNQQNAHFLN